MLKYIVVILAVFVSLSGFSQEVRVGLQENSVIKDFLKNNTVSRKKSGSIPLELPFIDDFSDAYIFPNGKKWIDRDAFINQTYGVYPPTLGVATLDALDENGALHSNNIFNSAIDADYLTSVPINLSLTYDNVVLSFYFQPQGRGDAPETQDSLLLDFYSPSDNTWNRVWDMAGTELKDFAYKSILVDNKYKQEGFQFRFHNKVSLTRESVPELSSNCDHWNIDYVYLDKDRSLDTPAEGILPQNDITFALPLESWIKDYEAMPYTHYLTNPTKYMKTKRIATIHNGINEVSLLDTLRFEITTPESTTQLARIETGAMSIAGAKSGEYQGDMKFVFPDLQTQTQSFRVRGYMSSMVDKYASNNAVVRKQVFANYYAYDDGFAEYGYGFYGEGTERAKLAYQFTTVKEDTLKGIAMYFNQTANNANKEKYFLLKVWTCKNGFPDKEIFSEDGGFVAYTELGAFHTFKFQKPIVVKDTFFVGFKQFEQEMLNIGLDINHDQSAKTFYNISGTWKNSDIKGALLIRPVFVNTDDITTAITAKTVVTEFNVYPNPAKEWVSIELPENKAIEKIQISIYDINGKLVVQKQASNRQENIDTRNFKSGVYIVKITDNQSFNETKKLIILK